MPPDFLQPKHFLIKLDRFFEIIYAVARVQELSSSVHKSGSDKLPQGGRLRNKCFELHAIGSYRAGPNAQVKILRDLVKRRQQRKIEPLLEFVFVVFHAEAAGDGRTAEEICER